MAMQPHNLVLYIQVANLMESSDPSTPIRFGKKWSGTKMPIP